MHRLVGPIFSDSRKRTWKPSLYFMESRPFPYALCIGRVLGSRCVFMRVQYSTTDMHNCGLSQLSEDTVLCTIVSERSPSSHGTVFLSFAYLRSFCGLKGLISLCSVFMLWGGTGTGSKDHSSKMKTALSHRNLAWYI